MGKALKKLKSQKGRFVGIQYDVVSSVPYTKLDAKEVKLLWDLMHQYTGSNNGMLSPCFSLMKDRGWAKSSLNRAFNGLQHTGFVVVTRQGWKKRGRPTLVAVTFKKIDEPREGVIYDEGISPSDRPLSYWCKVKSCWAIKPSVKDYKKSSSPNVGKQIRGYSPKLKLVS